VSEALHTGKLVELMGLQLFDWIAPVPYSSKARVLLFIQLSVAATLAQSVVLVNSCWKHCTLDSVELKGLQLRDCIACSVLWLSQRPFLIVVNSGKPCSKATRLQLHICGNCYKSIVLVVSRLFFLSQPEPLSFWQFWRHLSDTKWLKECKLVRRSVENSMRYV